MQVPLWGISDSFMPNRAVCNLVEPNSGRVWTVEPNSLNSRVFDDPPGKISNAIPEAETFSTRQP